MWKNFMIPSPVWEGEGTGGGTPPITPPAPGTPPVTPPAGTPPVTPPADPAPGTPPADPANPFPKVKDPNAPPAKDDNTPPASEFFGAPEGDYEAFQVPEGFSLDEAMVGKFAPLAKELGLSQAGAQKLADFYANEVVGPQSAAFVEQVSTWFDETQNDAEIGGQKFEASIDAATKSLNAFGTPGLKQLLVQYGIGNHPEVVRFFTRVGGAMAGEDTSHGGQSKPGGEPDFLTLMYGPKK